MTPRQAVKSKGGTTAGHLPDARPWPILVDPAGAHPLGRGVGRPDRRNRIAGFGLFMPPVGWGWAPFVWGYALAWFLVTDRVKLAAYWLQSGAVSGAAGHNAPKTKLAAKPGARQPHKARPSHAAPKTARRPATQQTQDRNRDPS
jgi:hypothetical protein